MVRAITVLVVGAHPVVREGLRSLLERAGDIEIVGEAGDGREAVDEARRSAPEVVLLDLTLSGLDGVDAIRRILAAHPGVAVVVLADGDEEAQIVAAVEAGAAGFLAKTCPPAELLKAVHRVAEGEAWWPSGLTRRLLAHVRTGGTGGVRTETLTAREREVLGLLASGASNREIAAELCIAEITVRTHVNRILDKLGVDNRVEAALYAVRSGLAPLGAMGTLRKGRARVEPTE